MLDITCPSCLFTRQVARGKLPAGPSLAACPRCGQRFEFTPPGAMASNNINKNEYISSPWRVLRTPWRPALRPGVFFSGPALQDSLAASAVFCFIFGSLFLIIGLAWPLGWLMAANPTFLHKYLLLMNKLSFWGFFIPALMLGVLTLFTLVGLAAHLLLGLTGGARSGPRASLAASLLASSAYLFNIIPIFGWIIGTYWYLVVLVHGLASLHRVSTPRVVLTLMALPLFLLCLASGLVYLLAWGYLQTSP